MKTFRSKLLNSLLCLLLVCAFCTPAFALYPWAEDPPGGKKDGSAQKPFQSGLEPGETVGGAANFDKTATTGSPRSDWLTASMYELTFYMYDLLAGNEQDGQSVAPDPKSRK